MDVEAACDSGQDARAGQFDVGFARAGQSEFRPRELRPETRQVRRRRVQRKRDRIRWSQAHDPVAGRLQRSEIERRARHRYAAQVRHGRKAQAVDRNFAVVTALELRRHVEDRLHQISRNAGVGVEATGQRQVVSEQRQPRSHIECAQRRLSVEARVAQERGEWSVRRQEHRSVCTDLPRCAAEGQQTSHVAPVARPVRARLPQIEVQIAKPVEIDLGVRREPVLAARKDRVHAADSIERIAGIEQVVEIG